MGIPVYNADERAKWLMQHNASLVAGVKSLFGEQAYNADGTLNRGHISAQAFTQPEMLQQLNALVHPAVGLDLIHWQQEHEHEAPYTLKEAALLYESGSYQLLDKIIMVYAPRELRIQRVMDRDGVTRAAVEARIDNQLPDEEKARRSHYIIQNDGQQSLIKQVMDVHKDLVKLARLVDEGSGY